MATLLLDAAAWREMYPQFAEATDTQITGWFDVACLLAGNGPAARIPYDPPERLQRQTIVWLIMCHLATLAGRGDMVGRLTQATQGSVTAGTDYQAAGKNAAWWTQTQCGATAWQLLKPYRVGGEYFHGC